MNVKKLVLASIFLALGVIIPFACGHAFGIPGTVLLPMHIYVFIGAMILGPKLGLLIGILTPIISMYLTGMPSPVMVNIMTPELAVYGLVSGFLYNKKKIDIYPALLISMGCGRVAYMISLFLLSDVFGLEKFGKIANVFTAIQTGALGIVIHIILVPIVVKYMQKIIKPEMLESVSSSNKTEELIKASTSKIKNEEFSFIVIKDNKIVYEDKGIGVSCIRRLIESNPELFKDSIVVDKIIGKAASMLLIPYGVKRIHTLLISKTGLETLNKHNIEITYDELSDYIINRTNDGMCPLEKSVIDIDDFDKAKIQIEETIKILMSKKN